MKLINALINASLKTIDGEISSHDYNSSNIKKSLAKILIKSALNSLDNKERGDDCVSKTDGMNNDCVSESLKEYPEKPHQKGYKTIPYIAEASEILKNFYMLLENEDKSESTAIGSIINKSCAEIQSSKINDIRTVSKALNYLLEDLGDSIDSCKIASQI